MIKKFFSWLFGPQCYHEFEVYEEHVIAVIEDWQLLFDVKAPAYRIKKIVLRCKKCGDMKIKKFKL